MAVQIGRRKVLKALAAGAWASLLSLYQAKAQARLERVSVAGAPSISNAGIYIAMEKGFFREVGIEVSIEQLRSGVDTFSLLATGQLDVGVGASGAGLFNALAQGFDVRIVADKGSQAEGHVYVPLGIAKRAFDEGRIRSLSDLKGKKVAYSSGLAGMETLMLQRLLKTAGLTLGDVEVVQMRQPDIPVALQNGAVDAGFLAEPGAAIATANGAAVILLDDGTFIRTIAPNGRFPLAHVFYGRRLIQNRDLGIRWMAAYLKGLRFYNLALRNTQQFGELVAILKKYTPVTEDELYKKMRWPYLSPDGKFPTEDLLHAQMLWRELGVLRQVIPLTRAVDFSYVNEAGKLLAR